MNTLLRSLRLPAAVLVLVLSSALRLCAQDNGRDGEPVVASIDPAKLAYDILVDGALPADDPAAGKFKTVQAAYAAAPAGTAEKPTVIGIKPGVYLLPAAPGTSVSLTITKNYVTFLGLTNNRRAVVLADNRGNRMGGGDGLAAGAGSSNGYVVSVDATGFTAKNLTFLNYCNVDYEYPGDPSKNLAKRSATITQAVALQAQGDKFVLENVALCSRLDTMFLRTKRAWFKNVFLEGTDDFVGGGTVSEWEDCRIVFPTGSGVMSASNVVFRHCRFEATHGLQFYKVEFRSAERPVVLLDCTLPVTSPAAPVAWVRGKAMPRPGQFSLTYHNHDEKGNPAVLYDSSVGAPAFTYAREISDEEAKAFNPWNLLRAVPDGATDDWDPAGVRAKYEAAGQGSEVFRLALTVSRPSVRTGDIGTKLSATMSPVRATDAITWSTKSDLVSLSRTTGADVIVTGKNPGEPVWVPVDATTPNGFRATAWVFVEPAYVAPPTLTSGPTVNAPADGKVTVSYAYDLAGHEDQSQIAWMVADDATGTNTHVVAVGRGNTPLKTYPLGAGDVGKFVKVGVMPKHNRSENGPNVVAMAAKPIAASDVKSTTVSPNFRDFVLLNEFTYVSGRWTLLGTWQINEEEKFVNGWGIRAASQGAQLLYQNDAKAGDMQVDLVMTPEKTEGMGFGSPGGSGDGEKVQKADIFIKYDPRTKNGYSLRFWRTTESTKKCRYQFFRITNGVATPLDDRQAYTGVFKPSTHFTLKASGTKLSVHAVNDVDDEVLDLEGTITPNDFGGAGISWFGTVPRGNSNTCSRFEISYPAPAAR